ncbi:MAG: ABC transporter permease, partial [Anaerolineales bacterium]
MTVLQRTIDTESSTRRRFMGIVFLLLGVIIYFGFSQTVEGGQVAVFGLTPGGQEMVLPDWAVPVTGTLNSLAAVSIALGAFQLMRGFGGWTNRILALIVGIFIFGFLTWAAAGKSLNLAGLFGATLVKSVPLTLGAMSGVLCERAGVVNIAIEGMMLTAAMIGTLIGSVTNSWLGLVGGIVIGGLLGLLHAWLSVTYKTDQIVSGTVINIFALGITSFISAKYLQPNPGLNDPRIFAPWSIPGLSDIPFLGPLLFNNNLFVYGMFLFLAALHFALFYTRWGLRLRSVGEH